MKTSAGAALKSICLLQNDPLKINKVSWSRGGNAAVSGDTGDSCCINATGGGSRDGLSGSANQPQLSPWQP